MRSSLRSATLNGYVGLADSLGLDAAALVRSVGLDPADLTVPDRWIPAAATALLLERSAIEAEAPDFALRLGELRRLSTLGPLSVVLREEPTLRGVLDLLLRYESSYNEALHMRLSEGNGLATVQMSLDLGELVPTTQALELAVAALHGIIRQAVGDTWHPISVCFSHAPPGELDAHHEVFGQRVRFDHEFTGLVFSARDLEARNALADPLLQPYAKQLLASIASPRARSTSDRVRETMEALLPLGRCSMDVVARTLGVDRRTLHRHLAAEGETFSGLLHETRVRLAGRHLSNERNAMIDVAELLGFSSPSAFTRWFSQQFGTSPREWRRTAVRAG